jgi:Na+-translocating ferredoxin:NAD+ oxidoreductase RnfG subunit
MAVAQLVCAQPISKSANAMLSAEFGTNTVLANPISGYESNSKQYQINNVWTIERSNQVVAYLFDISIKGRAHTFTSLVLMDTAASVLQVRITSYPSTHGVQITNRRWLSKLKIDSATKYQYGENVDALSGATISAKGLINSIESLRIEIKSKSTIAEKTQQVLIK